MDIGGSDHFQDDGYDDDDDRREEAPPQLSSSFNATEDHDKAHDDNNNSSRLDMIKSGHFSIATGKSSKTSRRSSLELRKLPVHVLLSDPSECTDLEGDDSLQGVVDNNNNNKGGTKSIKNAENSNNAITTTQGFLRRTCLNSKFSLRTQMMLSFGFVSAFTILLVVTVCIAISIMSGNEVNQITRQSFEELIQSKEGETARYLAESLTLRLLPMDLVHIMYEATRDRFAGYPIYEGDDKVPFWDMESNSNRYPIRGQTLPLDWQIQEGNVNEETEEEHVQHRWSWYQKGVPLSTENSMYIIQGECDPTVTDPRGHSYWPECSDANNNMTTGGVISPSPTNHQVYRKATDLSPLLKSLYEFYMDVKELGIYFANSGSGATIIFPHYQLNTSTSYVSIGCNWLLEPHPYDYSRYIGTMEDHARCETGGVHVKDSKVSTRLYNPMDRAWCRNQAQNPDKILSYGPYQSAWHENEWLMSIGRAVYDRVTNEFIGCIGIDYVLTGAEQAVRESIVTSNSAVTLVRLDEDGTVVASSAWDSSDATRTVSIDELNVGVSQPTFASLKQLVNFHDVWDPQDVRETFEAFHVREDGFLVSAYPVPPPPEAYDETYHPEFFAISSISESDINKEVDSVSDSVHDTVAGLISLTLGVGLIGLLAIVVFIFMVSHAITLPLNYMNDVSSDIVNTFGSHKEKGIEMSQTTLESKCSPKTELSEVVKQFQKMVSRFSGSAMARSMQVNVTEIDNRLTLEQEFAGLYFGRGKSDFKYKFSEPVTGSPANDENGSKDLPSRLHYGSVINDGAKSETTTFRSTDVKLGGKSLTSPLFFWIVALIVTPLLITTVSISTFVTYSISQGLFDIIDEAQGEFILFNRFALRIHSELRANYAAMTMRKSICDNFLLTRFSSWLLFGGVDRTDAYIQMLGGTEECKTFSDIRECPIFSQYSCDCAWNDRFGKDGTCEDFQSDSRDLQRTIFFGLSEDTLPDGDRYMSSYPNLAYSPESTEWWSNISNVPGSERSEMAAGHNTTYDRLKVMSAMPLFQAMYNADKRKDSFIATDVFFEADGMGFGYEGCATGHLGLSKWVSSDANGASELRPDLCPLGKHGYDPRCRAWYDTGMKLALLNNTGMYVTPPYHFAGSDDFFGQTCTSALIDPLTGEHVGQTLVDFLSSAIFEALNKKNTPLAEGGFPIVITGLSDRAGADTVIGPGFSLALDQSAPLGDVVLPFDDACPATDCRNRAEFEAIRSKMKRGVAGGATFERKTEHGESEVVHIAFAPVHANVLVPINASDFSRGVNVSDFLVYSLALAEPEDGMVALFSDVEDEVRKQIDIAVAVLAFVILFSIAFVVYMSHRITLFVTEPMIYLLQLIVHINSMNVDGNPPGVEVDKNYGSKEIVNVVDTMETLYRIVQSANVAYFNGDVERAYYVMSDAARLFKRLGNSKAEGVANNNLGNIMLAFYRTIDDTGVKVVCGFSKREVIGKGMGYYHRAIQLGEKAYDKFYEEEGWSPSCLEFMQHLSNRYFNRAMFLLTVKSSHEKPTELEELGLRDLQIATDMDVEIVDQGTEVGWDVRGADKMFDVYLSRIRGHLLLLEMGYEDKWEIEETLDCAFGLVKQELRCSNPGSSPLFKEFCPAGRMQQIETEVMRYKVYKGELECAAKIAIRMLVEDERTLQGAQLKAVEALVLYFKATLTHDGQVPSLQSQALKDLEEYQEWLQHASEERDRSRTSTCDWDDDAFPETLKKSMQRILCDSASELRMETDDKDKLRMSSLRASTRGDVTMEVF